MSDVLIFKFDEYSWYRNCLDEIIELVGESGVEGEDALGVDNKWTITIDASHKINKLLPTIEYYEGKLQ